MPRTSRMLVSDEKAVYHVMSRTALNGFPLGDVEKEFMLGLIMRYSRLYFTEILGFCLMGKYFHLLVKMLPGSRFEDDAIKKRLEGFYGAGREFDPGQIPHWREKLSNLSEFMREIKVGFGRYYNRRHHRRGYFWGDRFKSLISDSGIIGSKAFVCVHYQKFKHLFQCKHEKKPNAVKGLAGMYSFPTFRDGFLS